MADPLRWSFKVENAIGFCVLRGSIDEDTDFSGLQERIGETARVQIDMSQITAINSCGVREWIRFARAVSATKTVELDNCNPVVVGQMNCISNFIASARVLSAQAPFVCEECGREEDVTHDLEPGKRPVLRKVECPDCATEMVLDEFEKIYFSFMD